MSYVRLWCQTLSNVLVMSRKNISVIKFFFNSSVAYTNRVFDAQCYVECWVQIVLPVRCWVFRGVVEFCSLWFFLRIRSLLATDWRGVSFVRAYRFVHDWAAWSRRLPSTSLVSIVISEGRWWCKWDYSNPGEAPQYPVRYFVAHRCFPQFSSPYLVIHLFRSGIPIT